jgi:hypothetical protein
LTTSFGASVGMTGTFWAFGDFVLAFMSLL